VTNEVAALLSIDIRMPEKAHTKSAANWFIVATASSSSSAAGTRPWGHGRDNLPRSKIPRTRRL
jgi:hypothetical protein